MRAASPLTAIDWQENIHSSHFNATFTCHFVFQDGIEKSKRAIPLLADRFLQQECEKLERRIKQAMQRERTPIHAPANMTTNNQRSRLQFAFSEAARDRLARYDYSGNVRELQKIVSKAVGASLSPLVAGMEFRIAFERLTIDEKAVADAIEATMPCEVADRRADLAGKCVVKETWEERELRIAYLRPSRCVAR